jgi:hypothetical protein
MHNLGIELATELFSEATIEDLKNFLTQTGKEKWNNWMIKHKVEIFKFLESTPATRTKKWPNKDIRLPLILASLVYHRLAVSYQDSVEFYNTGTNLSYRAAHRRAADFGLSFLLYGSSYGLYPLKDLENFQKMLEYQQIYDGNNIENDDFQARYSLSKDSQKMWLK